MEHGHRAWRVRRTSGVGTIALGLTETTLNPSSSIAINAFSVRPFIFPNKNREVSDWSAPSPLMYTNRNGREGEPRDLNAVAAEIV